MPKDYYLWRVQKEGFAPAYEIEPTWTLVHRIPYKIAARLAPAASVPPGMTRVAGGKLQPFIPGLALAEVPLDDFLIDRPEVTNEDFKKFVDAGGYQKREFWKEPFTRDAGTLSFDEAIAAFRDATGRPGPATWELGSYRKGFEKHPVAGVSWYEAAAYAAFAGKTLPTVYHWNRAAQTEASLLISPASNFQGEDTQAVGDGRVSGFGTTDMAGNVKEWCSNASRTGKRFILGGGFGEPTYMFIDQDAQSPWDRRPNYGFRCVKLASAPAAETTARIEDDFRDFSKEKPGLRRALPRVQGKLRVRQDGFERQGRGDGHLRRLEARESHPRRGVRRRAPRPLPLPAEERGAAVPDRRVLPRLRARSSRASSTCRPTPTSFRGAAARSWHPSSRAPSSGATRSATTTPTRRRSTATT